MNICIPSIIVSLCTISYFALLHIVTSDFPKYYEILITRKERSSNESKMYVTKRSDIQVLSQSVTGTYAIIHENAVRMVMVVGCLSLNRCVAMIHRCQIGCFRSSAEHRPDPRSSVDVLYLQEASPSKGCLSPCLASLSYLVVFRRLSQ